MSDTLGTDTAVGRQSQGTARAGGDGMAAPPASPCAAAAMPHSRCCPHWSSAPLAWPLPVSVDAATVPAAGRPVTILARMTTLAAAALTGARA